MNPINGKLNSPPLIKIFTIFNSEEPRTAGIANWKENLKAFFGLIPRYSAVDIVIPDLDTPGITATHCASPIRKAFFIVILLFESFLMNLVKNKITPVAIIAKEAIEKAKSELSRIISILSKKNKAKKIMGIVPIKIIKISLAPFEFRFKIVFL